MRCGSAAFQSWGTAGAAQCLSRALGMRNILNDTASTLPLRATASTGRCIASAHHDVVIFVLAFEVHLGNAMHAAEARVHRPLVGRPKVAALAVLVLKLERNLQTCTL